VAPVDQAADRQAGGALVLREHDVRIHAGDHPVHLDHRHVPVVGELLKFLRGQVLRHVDQTVYPGADEIAQIVPLQAVVGVVAGHEGVVPVLPQHLVRGQEHAAEKGRGQGGEQNADGVAPPGLEAAGDGIDPVIQLGDGGADGRQIFPPDGAAVDILGHGGRRDPRQTRHVLDGCHDGPPSREKTNRFANILTIPCITPII